jgi:hypothetical protein
MKGAVCLSPVCGVCFVCGVWQSVCLSSGHDGEGENLAKHKLFPHPCIDSLSLSPPPTPHTTHTKHTKHQPKTGRGSAPDDAHVAALHQADCGKLDGIGHAGRGGVDG